MSNTKSTDKAPRVAVAFAALDPYLETVGVAPTEKKTRGDRISWGTGDRYPDYILELYDSVPTLRSIIDGTVDYIAGDDIILDPAVPRFPGFYPAEIVRALAHDLKTYGGFAIQVVRDLEGRPSRIYHLDMRHVRSNKDNTVFYYCENWQKSGEALTYPAFMDLSPETWAKLDETQRNAAASSVYFFKTVHTQTYPAPPFAAAVKDCEIERRTTDYHLNSLENGFVASAIVNFNNGQPDPKIMEETERDFCEKFAGNQNAGRIMFSWNKNKESATTIEIPKAEDFGEKYKALSTHSRQQIFASFRAIPILFGLTSEANTGFSVDEFEQSFRLYNRTQVKPAQRVICDAFEQIYGIPGALTIKPFTLDGADTNVD